MRQTSRQKKDYMKYDKVVYDNYLINYATICCGNYTLLLPVVLGTSAGKDINRVFFIQGKISPTFYIKMPYFNGGSHFPIIY